MPISKDNRLLYPDNWKSISWMVRYEAGFKCELCDAENMQPHPKTGSKVVLTVHHLDYNPQNNDRKNLIALCQRCHNRIDKHFRKENRKKKLIKEGERL